MGEQGLAEVVQAMKKAATGEETPLSAVQAAKLLIPPQKPELPRVRIPALEAAATHAEKAEAVATAAARGEISPDAASLLLAGIASMARVVEIDELARRVAALEKGRNDDLA